MIKQAYEAGYAEAIEKLGMSNPFKKLFSGSASKAPTVAKPNLPWPGQSIGTSVGINSPITTRATVKSNPRYNTQINYTGGRPVVTPMGA